MQCNGPNSKARHHHHTFCDREKEKEKEQANEYRAYKANQKKKNDYTKLKRQSKASNQIKMPLSHLVSPYGHCWSLNRPNSANRPAYIVFNIIKRFIKKWFALRLYLKLSGCWCRFSFTFVFVYHPIY